MAIMKKNLTNSESANNSNAVATVENLKTFANNLPEIEVKDETTTKSEKSHDTLTTQAEKENETESLKKNEVFEKVKTFLCPVTFDETAQRESLKNIPSFILSDDAKEKAIQQSKKEFFELHAAEIEAAEKLNFSQVVEKLKGNTELYNNVLSVSAVSELKEERYINNGKCLIYRGAQFTDKEGKNRYKENSISRTENERIFNTTFYIEERDVTTSNIILAIRYYSNYLDAVKRVNNQVNIYKCILTNVGDVAKRAKENGFSKEQIINEIEKVFSA